jgi:hypothetical protein
MFDNALMSLLPDAYEGLDSVTATPDGVCQTGYINSTKCHDGDHFSSCYCGPAYGSAS